MNINNQHNNPPFLTPNMFNYASYLENLNNYFMNNLNNHISNCINVEVNKHLTGIRNEITFMSKMFADFMGENSSNLKKIADLESDNIDLKKKVNDIEKKLENQKKSINRNNKIIKKHTDKIKELEYIVKEDIIKKILEDGDNDDDDDNDEDGGIGIVICKDCLDENEDKENDNNKKNKNNSGIKNIIRNNITGQQIVSDNIDNSSNNHNNSESGLFGPGGQRGMVIQVSGPMNGSNKPPPQIQNILNAILGIKPVNPNENNEEKKEEKEEPLDIDKISSKEVIELEITTINDIFEIANKYSLKDKQPNTLEPINGLYEYNSQYFSINIDIINKLVEPIEKLNKMIGLDKIKKDILEMILYFIQGFEKKNDNMLHTIIEGPPGVGKTELGKILAEIYTAMEIIPTNKFKLVKRTDLIGEYVGHTAHKTQRAIDESDGGVLFIDEAYSLGSGKGDKSDSFSKECIDTLNQNLSENKKKLIVIIAGYPDQLEESFFSLNPGLKRRFPFKFNIDEYSKEELKDILIKKVKDLHWTIDEKINDKFIVELIGNNKNEFKNFGGDIDNYLLNCKLSHAMRVVGKHPKIKKIFTKDDFKTGLERFKKNKKVIEEKLPPIGMYV